MASTKLIQIGNSLGVILSKETIEKLRVSKGDELNILDAPGGIMLTPFDDTFAKQMAVAERIMREDRDILRKLAQ